MAQKYVSETAAGKSLKAYVILNKKGARVAKVLAHFSNGGVCLVNVFDSKDGFQHATAGGYGYDKFSAALSGMKIDGHQMTDHCSTENAPKPPKGRHTFPNTYKPRKGYSLANWTNCSKSTGRTFYSDHWRNEAAKVLGLSEKTGAELTDSDFAEIAEKAHDLQKAWMASDDHESGYSSCFRESGLDYLRAHGYQIHQVL